jgi:hypothetical protein
MPRTPRLDLTHDLILPTLLFAALGGMTWAVRGCSGFGAVAGCIFAGVTWGAAWWFLSNESSIDHPRRYTSAWIIVAMTIAIGLSGSRGWMQWPSFFEGRIQLDTAHNKFATIDKSYGFLWLFIAGVPWAGLGACALAWCGSLRETRIWHWAIRIACGIGAGTLAQRYFNAHQDLFLPLYHSLQAQYHQPRANPNLQRLIGDCRSAITHLGYFTGFLIYEVGRRDWKNAVLILTVGLVNGAGWALCQNWKWANALWGSEAFNFWRCWESSGGISIGVAYGVAYFLVNRGMSEPEIATIESRPRTEGRSFEWMLIYTGLTFFASLYMRDQMGGWGNIYFAIALGFGAIYYYLHRPSIEWVGLGIATTLIAAEFLPRQQFTQNGLKILGGAMAAGTIWLFVRRQHFQDERESFHPSPDFNIQRWAVFLGVLMGLGLSIRNGLKGWFNIYRGNENYWSQELWKYLGPTFLIILILGAIVLLFRTARQKPAAYGWMWLVLIVQNTIAQLITGPHTQWKETAFSIYYLLLFAITAVIVIHYRQLGGERVSTD